VLLTLLVLLLPLLQFASTLVLRMPWLSLGEHKPPPSFLSSPKRLIASLPHHTTRKMKLTTGIIESNFKHNQIERGKTTKAAPSPNEVRKSASICKFTYLAIGEMGDVWGGAGIMNSLSKEDMEIGEAPELKDPRLISPGLPGSFLLSRSLQSGTLALLGLPENNKSDKLVTEQESLTTIQECVEGKICIAQL
jgi:hypothetical protein